MDLNGAEMSSVESVDQAEVQEVEQPAVVKIAEPAEDIEVGGCHVYQGK